MSNYDNWLTTTPEDEDNDRQDREDAARERIERKIDGKDWTNPARIIGHNPIDFEYDPMNPWAQQFNSLASNAESLQTRAHD